MSDRALLEELCSLCEQYEEWGIVKEVMDKVKAIRQQLATPIKRCEYQLATWVCCKNGKICSNSQDHPLKCFKLEKERSS